MLSIFILFSLLFWVTQFIYFTSNTATMVKSFIFLQIAYIFNVSLECFKFHTNEIRRKDMTNLPLTIIINLLNCSTRFICIRPLPVDRKAMQRYKNIEIHDRNCTLPSRNFKCIPKNIDKCKCETILVCMQIVLSIGNMSVLLFYSGQLFENIWMPSFYFAHLMKLTRK